MERAEIDILGRMISFDVDVILLEYHSDANRLKIDELSGDFLVVGGQTATCTGAR